MRKTLLLLAVLLLLTLCACTGADGGVYEVEHQEKVYTVDRDGQTITSEGEVYQYSIQGERTEIVYPNGAVFWWQDTGHGGAGGWEGGYEPDDGLPGNVLMEVLGRTEKVSSGGGKQVLFAILAVGIGGWGALSPRTLWYAAYGWRYRDARPSGISLAVERIGGVLLIGAGVWSFFF